MQLARLRAEVVGVARRMAGAGLVAGTSGNVSGFDRESKLVAITPSGMDYSLMTAEDVPVVDLNGRRVEGRRRPSTELPMHLAIYRDLPEVGAIVHTHSLYATALAVLGLPLPPILGEAAAMFGGEVRVAEYATTGTPLLGQKVVEALTGRQAALLKSHGAVAVGENLREALHVAMALESTARIYCVARMVGDPEPLPADEVERIRRGYRSAYGQRVQIVAGAAYPSGAADSHQGEGEAPRA